MHNVLKKGENKRHFSSQLPNMESQVRFCIKLWQPRPITHRKELIDIQDAKMCIRELNSTYYPVQKL